MKGGPKLVLTEGSPRKTTLQQIILLPLFHQYLVCHQAQNLKPILPNLSLSPSHWLWKPPLPKGWLENIYEIFEEDQQHTLALDTRKTSTWSSSRKTSSIKASLTTACDSSLVTKSVSKPSKLPGWQSWATNPELSQDESCSKEIVIYTLTMTPWPWNTRC